MMDDASGQDAAAGDASTESAGEEMSMDDDLASMMDDSAGGDASTESAGEEMSMDDDLTAMMGEAGGGGAPAAGGGAGPAAAAQQRLNPTQSVNLDFLLDIKLDVTFEVGRSKMLISDLLSLGQGSVIELHRLVGDELDLMVNGKLIAKGEVIVVNEKFGCKITEIISPEDRVKHIGGM
ncbi:MAG: flagellar motor switch protein FliN [Candidatus Lambdaproteobacteria bacterium]|nr:flagellar motor switch protein FliN [Candidatus Lambdaproteobacteria bacterium]